MAALFIAGAASLICWSVILVAGLLRTQPAEIQPGPHTLDHGDESPALVNLMVNGWRLTQDAIIATLVDLAARKAITFQQAGHQTLIHVSRGRPAGLRPYEEKVLDEITSLAHDGVVPAAALVRGESQPDIWPGFRKQVIADARAFGLSRPRWTKRMLVVLNLASLVPGVLAGLIVLQLWPSTEDEGAPVAFAIFACLFLWGNLFTFAAARQAERDTPVGQAAASRWLGYREYLVANEQFKSQPPAAVEIWDRHLAYAATFGVARAASQALPLGTHEDRWAWSAFGGEWHRVRITYPTAWSWGKSPLRMGLHGLWRTAAGAAGGSYLLDLERGGYEFDLNKLIPVFGESHPGKYQWVFDVGVVLAGLLLVIGVVNLVLAIGERISRRERVGEVLRLKPGSGGHHIAITDGQLTRTRAYRLFDTTTSYGIHEGTRVRLTAGRSLGYVAKLEADPGVAPPLSHPENRMSDPMP